MASHPTVCFNNDASSPYCRRICGNESGCNGNKGRVTSALKREIAYLSSHATGCRYCSYHAIRAAERYGSSEERMQHIWEYNSHEAFSEADRAAFDLAIAASQVPNAVTQELAENARAHWDQGEIGKLWEWWRCLLFESFEIEQHANTARRTCC